MTNFIVSNYLLNDVEKVWKQFRSIFKVINGNISSTMRINDSRRLFGVSNNFTVPPPSQLLKIEGFAGVRKNS